MKNGRRRGLLKQDPKWSVVVLSTGRQRETARDLLVKTLASWGFSATAFDEPDYPVDADAHSHVACLRAVEQHDIVVALLDESEGGDFQVADAPPEQIRALQERDILPAGADAGAVPTILEVEVLWGRAQQKVGVVLVPQDVEARIDEAIQAIKRGNVKMDARRPGVPDARSLIKEHNWKGLFRAYRVETGRIPMRQLQFIEHVRKEGANWITWFSRADTTDLRKRLRARIEEAFAAKAREAERHSLQRLDKLRGPASLLSLGDLVRRELIIGAPFEVESGSVGRSAPLLSAPGMEGALVRAILGGQVVVLLGDPGGGKSTNCLLCYRELCESPEAKSGQVVPVFGAVPELGEVPGSLEELVRLAVSRSLGRRTWPPQLQLPMKRWAVVLDGIDEIPVEGTSVARLIQSFSNSGGGLLACRRSEFDRQVRPSKVGATAIISLKPWSDAEIGRFVAALKRQEMRDAAAAVEDAWRDGMHPELLSFPLWLSLVAFLGQRRNPVVTSGGKSVAYEYELLRRCARTVAAEELDRGGQSSDFVEVLCTVWSRCAWEMHKSRRKGDRVRVNDLDRLIKRAGCTMIRHQVFAFVQVDEEVVVGFVHQVFLEYWLAEYIARELGGSSGASRALEVLQLQRSVVTNRLVRAALLASDGSSTISARLRSAYGTARAAGDEDAKHSEFVRNQLVYLSSRIDKSAPQREFLVRVWGDAGETTLVRHSAAFGSIISGNYAVEREYFQSVSTDEFSRRVLIGYHLYYYGDINVPESKMPPLYEPSMESATAIRQLLRRISAADASRLNTRRIDLLVLRSLFEAKRHSGLDADAAAEAVRSAMAASYPFGVEFSQGVRVEGERLIAVLMAQR